MTTITEVPDAYHLAVALNNEAAKIDDIIVPINLRNLDLWLLELKDWDYTVDEINDFTNYIINKG
jgi:hypothetical protein